jgi:hypothetical protein
VGMRFYKLILLVVALLCNLFTCTAQYAEETIKKLTAPNFHGRGYYKSGDHVAAKFINSEFISAGLKPVNGT